MYTYKAIVTNIVDGDTFDAKVSLGFSITVNHRFRVIGIDTPETYRPKCLSEKEHGLKATERAKELLLNKEVILQSEKVVGIYGRYGAKVTLEDGRDFAEIMISEGLQKLDSYPI